MELFTPSYKVDWEQWECTVCTNDMHHMQHFYYDNSFFIVVCTISELLLSLTSVDFD